MLKLYKAKVFASYQPADMTVKRDATDEETIKFPKESKYFDEIMDEEAYYPGAVLNEAAALDAQMELYLPEAQYDTQGKRTNRRERYVCVDGEGEASKLVFVDRNLAALKRNFTLATNDDPNFPCTRMIKLPALSGTEIHFVNPAFWTFVLKEFELKQWKRTILGEERSGGFKRGAHKDWEPIDFLSERPNKQRLPPRSEGFKPALGNK